ncbi:MAG TPA: hypothetical protein VEU62_16750, partial [Bryobacterales bacterium]|nr:hypothetical protein [Bryobacterales bacterium]
LQRTITQQEGAAPQAENVSGLVAGRDWLFADNNYYIDTSHVVSVIRLCLESDDPELLRRALELTDYGARLGPMFQYRGEPPFEDVYHDHAIYLRALLGEDVDAAVVHFKRKAEESDPDQAGAAPAQVLVGLLARLRRYEQAIDVSLTHLRDADPNHLACPNVIQLCQMAGDYARLTRLAREQGDLLSFAAARMQV